MINKLIYLIKDTECVGFSPGMTKENNRLTFSFIVVNRELDFSSNYTVLVTDQTFQEPSLQEYWIAPKALDEASLVEEYENVKMVDCGKVVMTKRYSFYDNVILEVI
jgi:hypothetical protein